MAFSPLNQRQEELARHRENKGRLAQAYARLKTTGSGTFEFEDRVEFGLTFIERPFIAVGWQIDVDQPAFNGAEGDDLLLPQCTGYVIDWDMTSREHYVGCWVAVSVALAAPIVSGSPPAIKVFHDFTWAGIALKDIPSDA